jgi:carboxypeptidase D
VSKTFGVWEGVSFRIRVDGDITECVNLYDIRLDDTYPACGANWPYELDNITEYLQVILTLQHWKRARLNPPSQRKDVTTALHAEGKSTGWVECDSSVQIAMTNQDSQSSVTLLPKILEKIPVMLYAGDQDFICNYVGIEALISALTWNGGTGLGKVQTQSWTVDGTPAGTWVTSRDLTYVKVWNAATTPPSSLPRLMHNSYRTDI